MPNRRPAFLDDKVIVGAVPVPTDVEGDDEVSEEALVGIAPRTICRSRPKFGVPSPVTGSQPLIALNPPVPQPGLEPVVISFIPSCPA